MKPDPMLTRKLKILQRIQRANDRGDLAGAAKARWELNALNGVRVTPAEANKLNTKPITKRRRIQ